VLFTHDTEHAIGAVVNLVNTAPETAGSERLPDIDSLGDFVKRNDISGVCDLTGDDLLAVRRLRGRFHGVFIAGEVDRAVALVNAIIGEIRGTPRLTDHDGHAWHVHFFAPGAALAEHLAADLGMALAYVLAAGQYDRLRTCAAPDCARVLVDLSRNRCRRFCDSRTCGNRMHVAAYRARRRAAG
jgi:hypothetical protein